MGPPLGGGGRGHRQDRDRQGDRDPCRIFIGGIKWDDYAEDNIHKMLSEYGHVKSFDTHNLGKGFAFAHFEDERDAKRATNGDSGRHVKIGQSTVCFKPAEAAGGRWRRDGDAERPKVRERATPRRAAEAPQDERRLPNRRHRDGTARDVRVSDRGGAEGRDLRRQRPTLVRRGLRPEPKHRPRGRPGRHSPRCDGSRSSERRGSRSSGPPGGASNGHGLPDRQSPTGPRCHASRSRSRSQSRAEDAGAREQAPSRSRNQRAAKEQGSRRREASQRSAPSDSRRRSRTSSASTRGITAPRGAAEPGGGNDPGAAAEPRSAPRGAPASPAPASPADPAAALLPEAGRGPTESSGIRSPLEAGHSPLAEVPQEKGRAAGSPAAEAPQGGSRPSAERSGRVDGRAAVRRLREARERDVVLGDGRAHGFEFQRRDADSREAAGPGACDAKAEAFDRAPEFAPSAAAEAPAEAVAGPAALPPPAPAAPAAPAAAAEALARIPGAAPTTLAVIAQPAPMPVELVDIALSFQGRRRLVKHSKSTRVGDIPSLHPSLLSAANNRPLAVMDNRGFEIGRELTLEVLVPVNGEILELRVEVDDWC